MIDGVERLVEMEKRLEKKEKVCTLAPTGVARPFGKIVPFSILFGVIIQLCTKFCKGRVWGSRGIEDLGVV